MPEITVTHIGIIVGALIIGVLVGWVFRGSRASGEKQAISQGWQEQLEAQRGEHQRLLQQNKSLMEQNSQYQASNRDGKMRASELSDALKEAFERRDELQRQLKDIRGNLEAAVAERDQLRDRSGEEDLARQVRERDARIEKLTQELKNWQDRLPPLIERFQAKSAEAEALEQQLAEARERLAALEDMVGSEHTRVEPVDRESLGDELDASNETIIEPVVEIHAAEEPAAEVGEEAVVEDEDAYDIDIGTEPDDFPDERRFDADRNATPRDDLKLIKGVGPAIEKTLNELGIRRFDQIAQMSEYDIDRVANRLKGFRTRIYREDWIGQARDLRDRKVSGQS